jgi:hypothetical protein
MNPYVILGVVVFWLASVGGAAWKGMEYQKGQDAVVQLEAVDKAVADANAQSQKDRNLAVIQAQRNTAAQTRVAMIRSQVNAAIQDHPQSDSCNWDQPTFSLLADAVNAANGSAADQGSVSDRVRKSNAADQQPSGRDPSLDVRPDRPVRRVPANAR